MRERALSRAPDVVNLPGDSLHDVLNAMTIDDARAALEACCGARQWVSGMLERRPFVSASSVIEAAEQVFRQLAGEDYLEAFRHHPAIGAPAEELRRGGEASRREQAGLDSADDAIREELRVANAVYLAQFGYVFLVFATGKSAAEMLAILRARLENDPSTELMVAAEELLKITRLRLHRLAR
jgi:OHCU decarboxylase